MNIDQICQIQSDCFRLLSVCFYEPEKDLLLEEDLCLNLSALLKQMDDRASEAAQNMQQALLSTDEMALKVDYAALFVGPFNLGAPPYSSVYLDKSNQVMGDSTLQVKTFYEEAGLQLDQQELPDHIAIELEFMSYLMNMEIHSVDKSEDENHEKFMGMRSHFFLSYLYPWIPELCQRIAENAETEFYRELSISLRLFSKRVKELLN